MKEWFRWAAICFLGVLAGSYAWIHARHMAVPANAYSAADSQPKYAEQEQAAQMVTVSGPLADYVSHKKPTVETLQPIVYGTSHPASGGPSILDHASDESPVGTSTALLDKTFHVVDLVDLPFDLPAHASTPQLRGTYRSFLSHRDEAAASDEHAADVEFLLLNERQYADLINGRSEDALFSADATSNGEVDITMPPTFAQSRKYYLVFRNATHGSSAKAVQADFRIDF
jgi:hypothetical protein